jgi:polysaccharide biosynthesis/export protein
LISARRFSLVILLGAALETGGCVFIAKDGPETGGIPLQASVSKPVDGNPVGFALVAATPEAIHAANEATEALSPHFGPMQRGTGPDVSIGVGDVLSITVFEGEAGGLFLPKEGANRAGNFVQVPNQQVDARGQITVPYVSEPISVAGRTARDVGREISHRLAPRAIEPQVVVTVVDKRGNYVSVLGDVNSPSKFSLDPGGLSLLAAIARAGGPAHPAYEETISIQRNGRTHKSWMTSIVNDPRQNVPVRPGDVIFLSHEQRVFLVLGATPTPGAIGGQNNRRFPFGNAKMSLTEAIATAGGLDSLRADPHQVFLFRFEPRSVLEMNGLDVSAFPAAQIPIAYSFDLSQGGTFFMTDNFNMRDKDLIFISDAPANDLNKVLNIVNSMSQSAYYGALVSTLR